MSPLPCHLDIRQALTHFQDGTHRCCVIICILHPWCISHLQRKTLLTSAGVAVTVSCIMKNCQVETFIHLYTHGNTLYLLMILPVWILSFYCALHTFSITKSLFRKCAPVGNDPCCTICSDYVKWSWRSLTPKRLLSQMSLLWKWAFSAGDAKGNEWLCEIREMNRGVFTVANMMSVLSLPLSPTRFSFDTKLTSLKQRARVTSSEVSYFFFLSADLYSVCVYVCVLGFTNIQSQNTHSTWKVRTTFRDCLRVKTWLSD